MGSPRQDLEAILEGTHLFRRGLQDDTNKSPTGWPAGIDSSFLGFEATSSRPADLADQCSDPLEIESFASKCHVPGGFRPVDQDDRQWPDPIDSLAPEAVESPTISSCPNGGTMPEKMRSALLQLAFGNDANNCYINSVLLAELWGCCMDSSFGWQTIGDWSLPLQAVVSQGPTLQWITDHPGLGPRLIPWFAFHEKG